MRPFDETEMQGGVIRHNRRRFNEYLLSGRIISEHAFGKWKGRFPALKNLPGRDITRTYLVVEALIILHNLFKLINDRPQDILGYNPYDADAASILPC